MSTTTLFILGATGDLTSRLLLPALAEVVAKHPDRELILRGAGHKEWDQTAWRETVRTAFADRPGALDRVRIDDYQSLDVTDATAMASLVDSLAPDTVLYFALPPTITAAAIDAMAGLTLPPHTCLAMEKPFGRTRRARTR